MAVPGQKQVVVIVPAAESRLVSMLPQLANRAGELLVVLLENFAPDEMPGESLSKLKRGNLNIVNCSRGNLEAAIEHINLFGSKHSDAIITENRTKARQFLDKVDSSCVYVNASTRFTDGYEFGLGAEMGISTDKLHARGPMALEELTTYKYQIFGKGQIRT